MRIIWELLIQNSIVLKIYSLIYTNKILYIYSVEQIVWNGSTRAEPKLVSNKSVDTTVYNIFVVLWCNTQDRDVSISGVVTSSI